MKRAQPFHPGRGAESSAVTLEALAMMESKYAELVARVPQTGDLSDALWGGVAGYDHTAASKIRLADPKRCEMTFETATRFRVAERSKKLVADIAELESGFTAGVKRSAGVKANVDPAAALLALLSLPGVRDNPSVIAALKAAGLVE